MIYGNDRHSDIIGRGRRDLRLGVGMDQGEVRQDAYSQPLNTTSVGPYVTVGECKQHRCAIGERIREEHDLLKEIVDTLKKNDERSEARAQATHQRIDPLIEEIGSVRGKIEYIEKAALAATVGGKK